MTGCYDINGGNEDNPTSEKYPKTTACMTIAMNVDEAREVSENRSVTPTPQGIRRGEFVCNKYSGYNIATRRVRSGRRRTRA